MIYIALCMIYGLFKEAWGRIHVSAKWVIIGLGNGLALVRYKAITWTKACLLYIRPYGNNQWKFNRRTNIFLLNKMPIK